MECNSLLFNFGEKNIVQKKPGFNDRNNQLLDFYGQQNLFLAYVLFIIAMLATGYCST